MIFDWSKITFDRSSVLFDRLNRNQAAIKTSRNFRIFIYHFNQSSQSFDRSKILNFEFSLKKFQNLIFTLTTLWNNILRTQTSLLLQLIHVYTYIYIHISVVSVQCLQCTRPAAIMTRVNFWTCVMITVGPVSQDTEQKPHPLYIYIYNRERERERERERSKLCIYFYYRGEWLRRIRDPLPNCIL